MILELKIEKRTCKFTAVSARHVGNECLSFSLAHFLSLVFELEETRNGKEGTGAGLKLELSLRPRFVKDPVPGRPPGGSSLEGSCPLSQLSVGFSDDVKASAVRFSKETCKEHFAALISDSDPGHLSHCSELFLRVWQEPSQPAKGMHLR